MSLLVTKAEIEEFTRYKRPQDQLAFLRSRGFHRADIHRGDVWLERSHYEAVSRGQAPPAKPQVRLMVRKDKAAA
jgi:hypothetical protein